MHMGRTPDLPSNILHGPLTQVWAQALVTQAIESGFNRRHLSKERQRVCWRAFEAGEREIYVGNLEVRPPLIKLMYLFGLFCKKQRDQQIPPEVSYFTPGQIHALGAFIQKCSPQPWLGR